MGIDTSKRYTATLDTTLGEIVIALDAIKAPKTVNNFVFLALNHYYDGVIFHRIINGFMCQGGDPTGTGTGGPGYRFEDELPKPREYQVGSVAMANAGPNTNGSQFFLVSGASGVGLPPAVQPVRSDREGPRRARHDAERADRPRRPTPRRRRDQLGQHRRGRLSRRRAARPGAWTMSRAPTSPARRLGESRSTRRGSTASDRPDASTADTCARCSITSG